jgi:hypothetical protein
MTKVETTAQNMLDAIQQVQDGLLMREEAAWRIARLLLGPEHEIVAQLAAQRDAIIESHIDETIGIA